MSRNKKDVILILWDYTESSEIALEHSIQLAREVNNYIMLVRFIEIPGFFVSKSKKEQRINEEKEKLKEVGQRISEKYGTNPFVAVEIGISPSSMKRLTKEANANLVVSYKSYKVDEKTTYTATNLVRILGAIDTPFILTQEKPQHNYYKEIVVPLYPDKRYKETLHWVIYLSKYYNCNINIIKPYIEDESEKKEMMSNIYFTKKTLDKRNIIYGIKTAKKKKKFEDELFRFAEMIDSDLIVMMARKFKDFIYESPNYDQKIPIMVINRNTQIIKYGGSFRG